MKHYTINQAVKSNQDQPIKIPLQEGIEVIKDNDMTPSQPVTEKSQEAMPALEIRTIKYKGRQSC